MNPYGFKILTKTITAGTESIERNTGVLVTENGSTFFNNKWQ